jgi:peroxiredoxin
MPELDRFYQAHNTEAMVLGVAVGDSESAIRQVIESGGYRFPVMVDPGSVGRDYDVSAIPTTFVLDSGGVVVKRLMGVVSADELTTVVRALATGK